MAEYVRGSKLLSRLNEEFRKQGVDSNFEKEVPKYLYRYCKVTDYLLENIKNNHITLSSPTQFNDEMDSLMIINTEKKIREKYEEKVEIARKIGVSWPTSFEKELKIEKDRMETYKNFVRKNILVSCFTENKDSRTMWGYYAQSNSGIRITYETTGIKLFENTYPVVYGNDFIDVSDIVAKETDENINLAMMMSTIYKEKEWDSEKEWRVLLPNIESIYKFNSEPKFVPGIVNKPIEICLGVNYFSDIYENNLKIKLLELASLNEIKVTSIKHVMQESYFKEIDINKTLELVKLYCAKRMFKSEFERKIQKI